jgi:hypothetical protein
MDRIKALKYIGLNDKEARCYLALLPLNQATAYMVALRSRIKKPTAYVVLESLVNSYSDLLQTAGHAKQKKVPYGFNETADGIALNTHIRRAFGDWWKSYTEGTAPQTPDPRDAHRRSRQRLAVAAACALRGAGRARSGGRHRTRLTGRLVSIRLRNRTYQQMSGHPTASGRWFSVWPVERQWKLTIFE